MAEVTMANAHTVGVRAKYLGPTNYLGSRWRVWRADETWQSDPDRMTVSYDYSLGDGGDNAMAAIEKYLARKGDGWAGQWIVACGDTRGYVAVKVPRA